MKSSARITLWPSSRPSTTTSSSSQFIDAVTDFVLWFSKSSLRCQIPQLSSLTRSTWHPPSSSIATSSHRLMDIVHRNTAHSGYSSRIGNRECFARPASPRKLKHRRRAMPFGVRRPELRRRHAPVGHAAARHAATEGCFAHCCSRQVACVPSPAAGLPRRSRSGTSGAIQGLVASPTQRSTSFKRTRTIIQRCILMTTDPGTWCSTRLAVPARPQRRRAVGSSLDHHRHLARGARARPRPHHGRALPVLPARRLARRPDQGSRGHPHRALVAADPRQHPPRLRLRARAPHHPQVHRQQRRDRRHLGEVAGAAGAPAREAQCRAEEAVAGVGDPARGRREVARHRPDRPRRLVAGRASRGRRRSTPPSPPRPSSSTCTTSPTRTTGRSASPAPSPSRASRRTACSA